MAHIIEGTWDEIKQYEAAFAGHRLRVIIDPVENDEEEDLAADIPPPPFSIKSREELVSSLIAGVDRLNAGKGIRVDAAYRERKAQNLAKLRENKS